MDDWRFETALVLLAPGWKLKLSALPTAPFLEVALLVGYAGNDVAKGMGTSKGEAGSSFLPFPL